MDEHTLIPLIFVVAFGVIVWAVARTDWKAERAAAQTRGRSTLSPAVAEPIMSAFAGFFMLITAEEQWRPLGFAAEEAGLAVGLLAWALVLTALWFPHRDQTDSGPFLQRWFFRLLGLPFAGIAVVVGLNGALDPAPPEGHVVRVLNRWSSRGRDTTTCTLLVEGWRPTRPTTELKVDCNVYNTLKNGDSALVTTGRGLLGWEWFRGIRAMDKAAQRGADRPCPGGVTPS